MHHLTTLQKHLLSIPHQIPAWGSCEQARSFDLVAGRLMPFYYGDGRLWFVMDMQTCEEVEYPPKYGPPVPIYLTMHRMADRSEAHTPCKVYFIGSEAGPIKIGFSVSPKDRMAALQAGSPVKLTLLATRQGKDERESAYHAQFAEHRLHGEWFEPHADILAEIERLAALQRER